MFEFRFPLVQGTTSRMIRANRRVSDLPGARRDLQNPILFGQHAFFLILDNTQLALQHLEVLGLSQMDMSG